MIVEAQSVVVFFCLAAAVLCLGASRPLARMVALAATPLSLLFAWQFPGKVPLLHTQPLALFWAGHLTLWFALVDSRSSPRWIQYPALLLMQAANGVFFTQSGLLQIAAWESVLMGFVLLRCLAALSEADEVMRRSWPVFAGGALVFFGALCLRHFEGAIPESATAFGFTLPDFVFWCLVIGIFLRMPLAPFHGGLNSWTYRGAFPGGWALGVWSSLAGAAFFQQTVVPAFGDALLLHASLLLGFAVFSAFYAAAAATAARTLREWLSVTPLVFNAIALCAMVLGAAWPYTFLMLIAWPIAVRALTVVFPNCDLLLEDIRTEIGLSPWGRLWITGALLAVAGFPGSSVFAALVPLAHAMGNTQVLVPIALGAVWTLFVASLLPWALAVHRPEAAAARVALNWAAPVWVVAAFALGRLV